MSYEHDDLSTLCVVELVESDGFATLVKKLQLTGLTKGLLVGFGMAFALFCSHLCRANDYGGPGQVRSSCFGDCVTGTTVGSREERQRSALWVQASEPSVGRKQ